MVKIIWAFGKKRSLWGATSLKQIQEIKPPGGEICWFCVNFPRDLKCQSLSSLTVEIAFKRRKQAIKYQCWCGVSSPTVVILLTLKF